MQSGNVSTGVPNTKSQLGFYSQGNKTGFKPVGYLLREDCEGTGVPSAWTNATGTPDWDYSAAPLNGAQSLYLSTNGAGHRVRADFTNLPEVWGYFKYKLTNGTVPSAAQNVIAFNVNGGAAVLNQFQLTTGLKLRIGTAGATTDALSLDTLYHVWVHYRPADVGNNGLYDIGWSTDGVRPTSGTRLAVAVAGAETNFAGRVWFGTTLTTAGLDQVFDDLTISDKPIGDNGILTDTAPAPALNADLNDTLGLLALSSAGTVGSVNADLNQTLGALSLSSTVTVTVAADLSDTLGTLALTSAGTLPVAATESSTLGTASLSSTGTVIVAANLSDTLGQLGLSAAGAAIVAASLNQTLGLLGLTSDGTVVTAGGSVNADLSVTLGSLLLSTDAVALEHEPGGIAGYLKREKGYSRLGGNVMVQTMGEATERAEKIMLGWRDEEEAMMLVQIIETFYD